MIYFEPVRLNDFAEIDVLLKVLAFYLHTVCEVAVHIYFVCLM